MRRTKIVILSCIAFSFIGQHQFSQAKQVDSATKHSALAPNKTSALDIVNATTQIAAKNPFDPQLVFEIFKTTKVPKQSNNLIEYLPKTKSAYRSIEYSTEDVSLWLNAERCRINMEEIKKNFGPADPIRQDASVCTLYGQSRGSNILVYKKSWGWIAFVFPLESPGHLIKISFTRRAPF